MALAAAIAGALLAASGVPSALAQSGTCLELENRLRALDSAGGFSATTPRQRQYERAIRDQRAQIAKTQRAATMNRCGLLGLFQGNAALCQRIRASLQEMNANLRDLEANLRNQAGGRRQADRGERNQILAALSANGCNAGVRRAPSDAEMRAGLRTDVPRRRTLLEQIFGVRTYSEDGTRVGTEFEPDARFSDRYGTFRTLCVRSCDGYYFPISFSTVAERFFEDEQSCQRMCPGAQAELFFHRMPSQDSEDMISYRTEEPYASLPNAFAYRKALKSECTCKLAETAMREIAGSGTIQTVEPAQAQKPALPQPSRRPDPGLDPETIANSGGSFDEGDLDRLIRRNQAPVAGTPGNRNVRIVGPAFFPTQ
jgi:hypothetical protein